MKRKLNDIDWQGLFQGKMLTHFEALLKLLSNITLKNTNSFIFNNKCKKSI